MTFDEEPMVINYPCPACDHGIVTETSEGLWECGSCTWFQRAGNRANSAEKLSKVEILGGERKIED